MRKSENYLNYSLLKEAQPLESKRTVEMGEEHRHRHGDDDDLFEVEEAGERKMLSRYGIWLLVELCRPKEDCPIVCIKIACSSETLRNAAAQW